jgi:DNA-binding NtrC family response regulator
MARVLIVDDEQMILDTLSEMLKETGHEVKVAIDGRAALKHIKNQPFDVAIVDVLMPQMDGLELMMAARQISPDMKVVAISGARHHARNMLDVAKVMGAKRILRKPFQKDELISAVQECLSDSEDTTQKHQQGH